VFWDGTQAVSIKIDFQIFQLLSCFVGHPVRTAEGKVPSVDVTRSIEDDLFVKIFAPSKFLLVQEKYFR